MWKCDVCKNTYVNERDAKNCEELHIHLLGCSAGSEVFNMAKDIFPNKISFNVLLTKSHIGRSQQLGIYQMENETTDMSARQCTAVYILHDVIKKEKL
jgi:hypothetical protein